MQPALFLLVMRPLLATYCFVTYFAGFGVTNGFVNNWAKPITTPCIPRTLTQSMPFFRSTSGQITTIPLLLSPMILVDNVSSGLSSATNIVSTGLSRASSSILISTVDSDIESIPTDEFGKVFAGGIFLMFGGVLSALIVGLILEFGNKYDQVMFDSFMQNEATKQDFLNSLSPEDRIKAEEVLAQMNISTEKVATSSNDGKRSSNVGPPATAQKKEEMSLFTDYDD